MRAPEQSIERTHIDADPTVHTKRVVDREPVQDVTRARARTRRLRRHDILVGVDVDAPVRALTRAEHANRAVLFLQRDDASRPFGQVWLHVGVLRRDRRLQHRSHRDRHAFDQAVERADPLLGRDLLLKLAELGRTLLFGHRHRVRRPP